MNNVLQSLNERLNRAVSPKPEAALEAVSERMLSNHWKAEAEAAKAEAEAARARMEEALRYAANIEVSLSTAIDWIEAHNGREAMVEAPKPEAPKAEAPKAEANRSPELRLQLKAEAEYRPAYFAINPQTKAAVILDKIPDRTERHVIGEKYNHLFKGLSNAEITSFRRLYSLADGKPVLTKAGSPKIWTCGKVYNGNCHCEERLAEAAERKAEAEAEAAKAEARSDAAIAYLRKAGLLPEPEAEAEAPKPGRSTYYDYDESLGTDIQHRMAMKAKGIMAHDKIPHAGLTSKPYSAMIKHAIENGVSPLTLAEID